MKKKLIAAVTSLVMVATMVPATVSATTGGAAPAAVKAAQTKAQKEIDAFKDEVKKLPDAASITEYSADAVLTAYKTADTKYKALGSADYAAVQDEITKMEAVKDKLVVIYVAKMTTEIDKVAQPGKVTDTEAATQFKPISDIEKNLKTDLGLTAQDVQRKVANYAKYDDAKLAQAFAKEIENGHNWNDTVENLSGDSGVIATFEKTKAYEDVKDNPTAQTYASNYKKYADAVAKVQKDKDDTALVKTYKDKVDAMATLLGKEPTEANIAKAEALLKEAEEKLKDIADSYTAGALYERSKTALETAIETAQTAVEDKKAADDFAAKVTAVGTVELNDMAKLQEIFRLQTALNGKLDPTVNAEATNKIGQLKTLIEKVPAADKEFTELVVASFPVPAAGDVTADHDNQVTDAYTVLSNTTPKLVGVDISSKLDTDLAAYKTAKANVDAANTALTGAKTAAEKAATDFITNVFVTLPTKVNDADYELLLNKAKEDYNKLAARYKEGGADYTKNDFATLASTGQADQGQSVKSAMAKLDEYFKDLTGDATAEKDKALLKELFAGIDKLPTAAKLTIADKDTVYALRDKKDELSDKGLITFTSTGTYNSTLTVAIQKIDQLVVADLIKQISALKEVKADAALADIQAAKKANKAARDAYDALTATQKKEVTNYAVLVGAEKAVETAEVTYVKAQMKEIAALDTAKLTVAQARTIVDLQAMIDDMTSEQTTAVKEDSNYKAFQTALAAAQTIVKKATDLEQATVTAIADQTYTGEAVEPAVEVKNAFDEVVPADAYKVTYKQNVNVGTAIVIIASTTEGGYTGSITATFEIKGIALKAATVTGVVSKTYTGKALTQKVVVKANGKTLKNGTDYTVSYKNNKNVGKAAVTVKAKGNYTGTITKTFIVKPAKESITSLKKGTKRFTVKYKKQSGAKYQIYYKTAGSKAKTVKTSAVTKTVKNLKKGKTYTVKVRAYKAIDGKTYYGAYSKAKKVKVR